jgi:hypothetical protein
MGYKVGSTDVQAPPPVHHVLLVQFLLLVCRLYSTHMFEKSLNGIDLDSCTTHLLASQIEGTPHCKRDYPLS